MKHLEAGLVVGAAALIVVVLMALTWKALSSFLGDMPAALALLLVATIATITVIVDWKTERKETPK